MYQGDKLENSKQEMEPMEKDSMEIAEVRWKSVGSNNFQWNILKLRSKQAPKRSRNYPQCKDNKGVYKILTSLR